MKEVNLKRLNTVRFQLYDIIGEGNGNPLQNSCLGNPMGRGGWLATVHGDKRVRHHLATEPPWEIPEDPVVESALSLLWQSTFDSRSGN